MKLLVFAFATSIILFGCDNLSQNESFSSIELTSSQNEIIYINSVNWGLTGDNQRTIITKVKNRLKNDDDTAGTIDGLSPFIYSFDNDSLKLYFNGSIIYHVSENFETISVIYFTLENPAYMNLSKLAANNERYHFVPLYRHVQDSSIPMPPKK